MKRQAILTSILTIVLALSMVAFSFSWQSMNVSSSQKNGKMAMAFDDTTANYDVYKYDLTESKGKKTDEGIENITFNPYDLIFLQRNRYTPVFARIEVKRVSSMPKEGTLYLTIDRTSHGDESQNTLSRYSSSIMRYTAKIDKNYLNYIDNDHDLYMHIDGDLYVTTKSYMAYNSTDPSLVIPDSSKVFVTVSENGGTLTYTKTDSIVLSVDYSESDWVDPDASDGIEYEVLNVCLYITYDEGLVNCYKGANGGSASGTFSAGSDTIAFENDMSMIKISYGEKEDN